MTFDPDAIPPSVDPKRMTPETWEPQLWMAYNNEDGGMLVHLARMGNLPYYAGKIDPLWRLPWAKLPECEKQACSRVWDSIVGPYVKIINGVLEERDDLRKENRRLEDKIFNLEIERDELKKRLESQNK